MIKKILSVALAAILIFSSFSSVFANGTSDPLLLGTTANDCDNNYESSYLDFFLDGYTLNTTGVYDYNYYPDEYYFVGWVFQRDLLPDYCTIVIEWDTGSDFVDGMQEAMGSSLDEMYFHNQYGPSISRPMDSSGYSYNFYSRGYSGRYLINLSPNFTDEYFAFSIYSGGYIGEVDFNIYVYNTTNSDGSSNNDMSLLFQELNSIESKLSNIYTASSNTSNNTYTANEILSDIYDELYNGNTSLTNILSSLNLVKTAVTNMESDLNYLAQSFDEAFFRNIQYIVGDLAFIRENLPNFDGMADDIENMEIYFKKFLTGFFGASNGTVPAYQYYTNFNNYVFTDAFYEKLCEKVFDKYFERIENDDVNSDNSLVTDAVDKIQGIGNSISANKPGFDNSVDDYGDLIGGVIGNFQDSYGELNNQFISTTDSVTLPFGVVSGLMELVWEQMNHLQNLYIYALMFGIAALIIGSRRS